MTVKSILIQELKNAGITNKYSIAAILSVVAKESNFRPQSEASYATTSNERIKSIFSITRALNDTQLNTLKRDPVKFFNFVYGSKMGNSAIEGYTYRGRGLNQLTGKNNYLKFGNLLKLDLIKSPDLVNDPAIASKIVALYFKEAFKNNAGTILTRYKAKNINDFKDTILAVNAFYNANAGFGKDTSKVITQGKTKALSLVDTFLKEISKPATGLGIIIFAAVIAIYLINK
jgi:predicted chitinase